MKRFYWLFLIVILLCSVAVVTASAGPPEHTPGSGARSAAGSAAERGARSDETLLLTTWAITRTEDTDPAIVYTGSWTPVTNPLFTGHASHGDFTESSTPGDTASFSFSGPWIHLGFATNRSSGEAEILVDGVSRGTVDLYSRDDDVAGFVFAGLADTTHTLEIVVAGTGHPNSSDVEVQLDFIDTWDGTLMPDGTFEENNSRVWYSLDWDFEAEAAASGGGYAVTGFQGDNTAWFPFTGDTVVYHALAFNQGGLGQLFVDGQPLAALDLYSPDPVTRSYSFAGLGSGPHILTVRQFLGNVTLDAFSTPGSPPFYTEPVYTGIVRYEEYHPAIKYNGYGFSERPPTWTQDILTQASRGASVRSRALNDTISLTFTGQWVNLGFLTRNQGGQAEVFIDGVSRGIIGLYSAAVDNTSFQYGGLSAGTHTLTVTVLGQPDPPSGDSYIYLDYIDVWDGTAMPDAYANARRSEPSGRIHFSSNLRDIANLNAYQGDYIDATLPNGSNNLWYAFTGDSFTYLAFSHPSNSSVEVYLDDVLLDTPSLVYPYSQQPLAFHYTGFDDGPHVVRVHNVWNIQVDAFASNPSYLGPYRPIAEWWESDRTAGASIWGGIHVPIAVGDVTGDGAVELVVASSNVDNNGELFLLRGDGGDTGDGDPILWSVPYNIFNGFEEVGAPAIAELDGQPGAEIIHPTADGLYVYHSDGSTYWMTDTLTSHVFFAAPAVGNLDLDPEPEIAVNLNKTLAVFEADGTLAWQTTLTNTLGMPLLADLTGDGELDILLNDSGDKLFLYDYNLGSPALAWSHTFTTPLHIYGSPAVADIDGQLPGGDPGPEIAIASEGWAHVLDAGGSVVWSEPLDSGRSGGVAIADLDGDGEVEIVTSMLAGGGRIYALNADGSRLWDVPALDNSPLSVSLADLDGDGAYEVAWNGADQGLTLFAGTDGEVLFNEPHLGVVSQTGSDYPLFADVDQDGFGELVVAAQTGVRVFGFDGYWGPARELWNQHSYHITNVDADLAIPAAEPDSWADHNTYRAQFTPGQAVRGAALASADSDLAGQSGTTVVYLVELTNTGNRLDTFSLGYAGNLWSVNQPVTQITLAAGESRQILVEVIIPAGAADGQTDTVTIAAVSVSDPAASASVELTTTAMSQPTGSDNILYLPIIQN